MGKYKDWKRQINKPLAEKVQDTKDIIECRLWQFDNPIILWSGGLDSTLVLHFVREMLDTKVLFNNTTVEYPETIKFIRMLTKKWDVDLIETKPEMTFWQVVEKFGMPEIKSKAKSHGNQCCKILKEKPGNKVLKDYDLALTGITTTESMQRRRTYFRMGYCYHSKLENIQKVHPLWHWKQEEVKKYTQDNNIPMNEIYKKLKRSGCWPCTAFKGSMKVMNKANPQYAKMVSKRRGNTLIEDY